MALAPRPIAMDDIMPGLSSVPNWHPLLIHFPIALLYTALFAWLTGLVTARERAFRFGRWSLWLGIAFAVPTLLTGLSAAHELIPDDPTPLTADVERAAWVEAIRNHQTWMLATAGLAIVTGVLSIVFRRQQRRSFRLAETAMLFVTVVVLTLGADRGGYLVYGLGVATPDGPTTAQDETTGTQPAPPPEGR